MPKFLYIIAVLVTGVWQPLLSQSTNSVKKGLDPQKLPSQYVHKVWQTEQGLPQNAVSGLAQTPDGYIWIATQEGLVRFDGLTMKIFDRHNSPLPANNCQALGMETDGTLWVAVQNQGIVQIKDNSFTSMTTHNGLSGNSIPDEGSIIVPDPRGGIWVGTSTAGINHIKNGRVVRVMTTNEGLLSNQIGALTFDREGFLWVGTNNALMRINTQTYNVKESYTAKDGLLNASIRGLCQDQNANIWIGTQNGLQMWNGKNWKTFSSSDGIPAKNINELFCDSQGTIWIGTFGSGIYRYSQDHFDSFTVNDGLPTNSINCFLEDQEGGLFIGLVSGGLNRISNGSVSVLGEKSFNDIWSILEDSNKTLWFTLFSEGVAAIHRNGEWNYLKKQNGLPSNNAKGIYEDLDGSLWIGTIDQGCCRLINGKITEKYSTQNGLINNSVRSFLRDSRGTLWIGTDRGVSCLINGIFHNYGKNEGLSNERAPVLYEDKSSQVWVGTREGLFVFKNNSIVHSYTRANGLTVPDILALREDSNNVFWIGTAEGGIYRLKNGSLVNINVQHGLFDNVIYSLLEDDVGYIWISCNKGIFCVKKSDLDSVADGKLARLRCKIFGTSDGMISAECNGGSQPSAIRSSDGRLWFPTIRGAVTINPKNLYKNEIPPKIILEEIRIDGIIDSVILRQNGIELPSSTEKLEFQYTAICLTAAERVKFKYMLEGFDKEWVEAENRRTAYYTNLPKGRKYRFRVIACNNDGVWNEKGTWIEFSVKPFWWTTSWFYAICIIIICSLVYFSILWRTNRLLKRAEALENIIDTRTQEIQNQAQQIQLKNTELSESLETLRRTQNQLAQAEKMASLGTLVAGVAHELNTPIGVAVTAASTLHGKVQTFENEYKAGGLKKSTLETFIEQAKIGADLTLRNLARAANLIQSFKQVAVDQTSDNKRRFHLHKYLHEVITSLEPKWKATQHRVEITCDENLVLETYPGAIAQIITNLIENSLLHGFSEFTETGIMRISAEQGPQSNRITITYSDTGRGIPSEILPRIFDPFFTTKQAQGGTGLGMHIVYNLVTQKLGGEIHCASEAERGTTFTITLPV